MDKVGTMIKYNFSFNNFLVRKKYLTCLQFVFIHQLINVLISVNKIIYIIDELKIIKTHFNIFYHVTYTSRII